VLIHAIIGKMPEEQNRKGVFTRKKAFLFLRHGKEKGRGGADGPEVY